MLIVYLRPFDVDKAVLPRQKLAAFEKRRTITEIISAVCQDTEKTLKMVADPLGSFGKGTLIVDEDWERVVSQMVDEAEAAAVVTAASPGTIWEMRKLAKSNKPALVLRNPLLPELDSSLLLAAAWDLFDGYAEWREAAGASCGFERSMGRPALIPGDRTYSGIKAAIATWIGSLPPSSNQRSYEVSTAQDATSKNKEIERLLAVTAGLRRSLRELDNIRDQRVKIGDAGSRALLFFSLSIAAYTEDINEVDRRLQLLFKALGSDDARSKVESAEVVATFFEDLKGGHAGLLLRLLDQLALTTDCDWRDLLLYSQDVNRIWLQWRDRVGEAAHGAWRP